ncbi:MAG: GTP 3',8-cyclase MoaA, partial [bacterium]
MNDSPSIASQSSDAPRDHHGRGLHDLRVSVTDRCNFRCEYCMPKDVFGRDYRFLPRRELLRYEEIETLVRAFIRLGVRKVRLTGGEPLLRHDLESLIARLARLDGLDDLAITTNASLLTAPRARALRDAGIRRVNISLDALDAAVYRRINRIDSPLQDVLDGIAHALAAGFDSVKINMVVQNDVNVGEIIPMARRFRGSGAILRFIEFMDVGNHNQWSPRRVFTARRIVDTIHAAYPLTPLDPNYRGEVAKRWRYADGAGEIGVISSISQPFCGACARARLSAVGELYTCLFASAGFDLRALLRAGIDEDALAERIGEIWRRRRDRYSEERGA